MPVTDELPPLALEVLRTLRQTYDHRGPNAFDEDAAKVFHVIGSIIARISGRERLAEAVQILEADLQDLVETEDGALGSLH
jgi:hypothetical protein